MKSIPKQYDEISRKLDLEKDVPTRLQLTRAMTRPQCISSIASIERGKKKRRRRRQQFFGKRFPSAAIFQRRARLTTLWKSEFMKASRHFYPRAAVKIYNLFEQVRASPRPFVFSPRDDTHSRFLRNSFHPLNVTDFYKYKHTRCKSFE